MIAATRTWSVRPTPPSRGGCTTTLSEKGVNPCTTMNGIQTAYPSTETAYTHVNCNGCSHVHVVKQVYYCPMDVVTAREMVPTPSTSWSTICSPSTALGPRAPEPTGDTSSPPTPHPVVTSGPAEGTVLPAEPQLELVRKNPNVQLGQREEACPTTFTVQPEKSAGSMTTEYQQWITTMVQLNCGGCPLVLSTALGGYGPAGRFTETVTVPVGTSTIYSCQ